LRPQSHPKLASTEEVQGFRFPTRIGLAATVVSPALCLLQIRVDNDTPSFAAFTCVAPGVRFSDLAIFVTPALALAIVFICRISSLLHSRRAIFLVLAIVTPIFWTGLVSRGSESATVKDMKHPRVRVCRATGGALALLDVAVHSVRNHDGEKQCSVQRKTHKTVKCITEW